MPAVSVIINTYNSARFIHSTLASVMNQTWTDFELIVVDDGSQDDTLLQLAQVHDSRLRIYPYPNGGIAVSRNRGLQLASAELIAFLDHDDRWHPDKLEQQVAALSAHPQAALAYSWTELIDLSGQVIRSHLQPHHSGNIHQHLLTQNFLVTASNPLIKRQTLLEICGFDPQIYGADDWDVFLRLTAQAEAVLCPACHVQYRIVPGSGSANVAKLAQGCERAIAKAFDQAEPTLQPLRSKAIGHLYQYLCFKVVEDVPNRRNGWTAGRYWLRSHRHHPDLWTTAATAKISFKVAAALLLPPSVAKNLITWATNRFRDAAQA